MREIDIERSASDDLLEEQLWTELWTSIRARDWDVVLLTPPCNTFSRARCNAGNSPGPVQLRNVNHPWGFPWLTGANALLVKDHNYLLLQCFKTMHICVECETDYLFEHPEDLGRTPSNDQPASVWQLAEMREFVEKYKAWTFALFQCHFGA